MALMKACPAHWAIIDGVQTWVEQRDEEMHPIQEALLLAHWAAGEHYESKPQEPTLEQITNWLVEHDASYVKKMKEQHKSDYAAWEEAHKPYVDAHLKAHAEYAAYCEKLAQDNTGKE